MHNYILDVALSAFWSLTSELILASFFSKRCDVFADMILACGLLIDWLQRLIARFRCVLVVSALLYLFSQRWS